MRKALVSFALLLLVACGATGVAPTSATIGGQLGLSAAAHSSLGSTLGKLANS